MHPQKIHPFPVLLMRSLAAQACQLPTDNNTEFENIQESLQIHRKVLTGQDISMLHDQYVREKLAEEDPMFSK